LSDCAAVKLAQKKRASTAASSAGPKYFPQVLLTFIKPFSHAASAGRSMSSLRSLDGMSHGYSDLRQQIKVASPIALTD
jgi:hypothetical protein